VTTVPLHLRVGGQVAHPDWKSFDVRPGPHVDFVGDGTNLAAFNKASAFEIYIPHVLEHLGYIEARKPAGA
jgi:predicted SAM-dependent methyltransferase